MSRRPRKPLAESGKCDAAIAHDLVISLETVRNHLSSTFTKVQVSDRAAAIVTARYAGLCDQ